MTDHLVHQEAGSSEQIAEQRSSYVKHQTGRGVKREDAEAKAVKLYPDAPAKPAEGSSSVSSTDGEPAAKPAEIDLTEEGLRNHPEMIALDQDAREFGHKGRTALADTVARLDPSKLQEALKASGIQIRADQVPALIRQGQSIMHSMIRTGKAPQSWGEVIGRLTIAQFAKPGASAHGDPVEGGMGEGLDSMFDQIVNEHGEDTLKAWVAEFAKTPPAERLRALPIERQHLEVMAAFRYAMRKKGAKK